MTFTRKKEMCGDLSTINVYVHKTCIIVNTTFQIQDNILFQFNEYKKVIKFCEHFVNNNTIKLIEEYLINNCNEIKELIKLENEKGQLSLF